MVIHVYSLVATSFLGKLDKNGTSLEEPVYCSILIQWPVNKFNNLFEGNEHLTCLDFIFRTKLGI